MIDSVLKIILYLTPKLFCYLILIYIFSYLYNFYTNTWKHYKNLPSMPVSFGNILYKVFTYFSRKQINNICHPSTISFQHLSGNHHLYKNESIMCMWFAGIPFISVISPDAVKEVLEGTEFNKKAWFYKWMESVNGTGLLNSYGKKWKSRRKLLTPAFHFDILKDFMPIINRKSSILIKKWKCETVNKFTDIIPDLSLCSLDIICETALGIDIKIQENNDSEFLETMDKVAMGTSKRISSILGLFDFTYSWTIGRSLQKDIKWIHDFTTSIIRNRKKEFLLNKSSGRELNSKRKPFMDILLHHQFEKSALTEEGIREEVNTFISAGSDTTSLTLIWTLYLIGLYKEVQLKIQEELDIIFGDDIEKPITAHDLSDMKYLECVIKESLRLYPPTVTFGRTAGKNTTICGYTIPEGATLVIFPYQLHRNEKFYPNPEIFDPNRFTPDNTKHRHPFAFIPFSAGPRNCIGQRFAMMETKTVLADILRNFTVDSLDTRDKLLPGFQITLNPTMPVRVKIRQRENFKSSK